MSEFFSERAIKATRKPHTCEGCRKAIPAGLPAMYFAVKMEGELWAGHYHTDCRAAEIGWNEQADQWGDEYSPLSTIRDCEYSKEWCAWLVEKFPAVAARILGPKVAA